MYLSGITGNILNKFNKQTINILYEPQYNLFDMLVAECGANLFISRNDRFVNAEFSNFTILHDHQFDLFNYNLGITNNIIGYSQHKKYDILHLNTIIFTHSYKPSQIKKEDAVLLKNNLRHHTKVFFNTNAQNSWRLGDSVVMSYGIPQDKFYIEKNVVRNNRILMLNLDNNPNVITLVEFLEKHNILVDVVKNMSCDSDLIRKLFNQYSVCVDLNDYNISNLLVGIACGCKAITYATPMIMENYSNTPNLYTATTIQDLISSIERASSAEVIDHSSYFETHYGFEDFKKHIDELVLKSNNKAYII